MPLLLGTLGASGRCSLCLSAACRLGGPSGLRCRSQLQPGVSMAEGQAGED